MSKQLRVYREGAKTEFDYQILWEEDFTKLADAVKKLELSCGKICIVADDTVGNLYGKEVQKALEELDFGMGLDNIFNKRDTRPNGVNYALLSPGRMAYVSLTLRFKK